MLNTCGVLCLQRQICDIDRLRSFLADESYSNIEAVYQRYTLVVTTSVGN